MLKVNYRPDIDGLRAIAVLSVVLYHINPAWVPGGYVGVDIFFVISGFLITGNILREQRSGHGFSWSEFYRRRALRILPVLFFVILSVLLVGHLILLPNDLLELSWSALAGVFSVPNIYFTYFLDTSYFADDSSHKPLLHLWSLGVEEQFYFLWPLLLVLLSRILYFNHTIMISVFLMFSSFFYAQSILVSNPMFAYYMLPARAGELLIGAVMAMFLSQWSYNLNVLARLFLGVLGLGLICYSMFFFTSETLFPGYNSLVPTLGAAFLILTGSVGGGFITRFLSLKVAVLIGLISYSLYLWHWPILALYRYVYGDVGFLAGIFLLALMFVFSFLSYRFVEKPFRKLNLSFKLVLLRLIAPAVAFLLIIICFFIVSGGFGLYAHNSHYIDKMNSLQPDRPAYSYRYVCQKSLLQSGDLVRPDCIINGLSEPRILLWGDSNAAHYVGVLGAYAESAGFSFRNIAHSSCPPLLEGAGSIVRLEISGNCDASVEVVKKTLDKYEMIILGGAWDTYARHPDFFLLFEETLNSLVNAGKGVLILGVIPRPINVDRSCEIKSLKQLVPDCDSEDSGSKIPNEVNSKLKELASKFEQISYYDVTDGICPEGECSTVIDDKLVYFDRSHFSMEGSWLIGKTIIEQQGLPTLFNDFSKYSSKTDSLDSTGLDWVEIVSFQNSFAPLTRGSAFRSAVDDGFLLEDSSEENYESVRLRLPVDSNTSEYYVKVVFSNCSDTLPMLRLREQLTDKRNQYDAQFDCNSNKLVNRGDLEPEDVSVTVLESGSIEIIVRYTVASELDSLVMELFPAVGPSLRRYNRASVGSIVLNSIDVAVKGEI